MKKTKKLQLNRETLASLAFPDLAKGGRPSDTAVGSECLTDYCSIHYCFTHLDTCVPCPI